MKNVKIFLITVVLLSISISCVDEKDYLQKNDLEISATVTEQPSSFNVNGYYKSLNPSKRYFYSGFNKLELDVSAAPSWKSVILTISVDEKTKIGLLGDYAVDDPTKPGICYIFIEFESLNESHPAAVFSIKFDKNVTYDILIKCLSGSINTGIDHGDGLGCGDSLRSEDILYEISRKIISQ
jgi:hypothetical protein